MNMVPRSRIAVRLLTGEAAGAWIAVRSMPGGSIQAGVSRTPCCLPGRDMSSLVIASVQTFASLLLRERRDFLP
jgi:hypothetical protein